MDISSIVGPSGSTSGQDRNVNQGLGRDDFLKLLITQLQMQDPFQPLDNEAMVAQLATFSSLEQLEQMNDGLQENLDVQLLLGQLLNNTMATGLIGKEVHVDTDQFQHRQGESVQLGVELQGYSQRVEIDILDEDGKLVRTLTRDQVPQGSRTFEWDGRDESGNVAASGSYTFQVRAIGPGDTTIANSSYLIGEVDGIRYRDGQARIVVGDNEFVLGSVRSVHDVMFGDEDDAPVDDETRDERSES